MWLYYLIVSAMQLHFSVINGIVMDTSAIFFTSLVVTSEDMEVQVMSQRKLQESPTEKVVEVVNDLGLKCAARKFKTSPATLSRWLKAQNYMLKRIYVRKELAADADPLRL